MLEPYIGDTNDETTEPPNLDDSKWERADGVVFESPSSGEFID